MTNLGSRVATLRAHSVQPEFFNAKRQAFAMRTHGTLTDE